MLLTLRRLLPSHRSPPAAPAARATSHSNTRTADAPAARHPGWVMVLVSIWMATVSNLPLWREVAALPGHGSLRGWGFVLAFGVIVVAGNTALLCTLAWRRAWVKPVAGLMVVVAALGACFMLAYGIAIDASMLVNVLQTDVHEAGDLLGWRMVFTVLALAGPPLLWLQRTPLKRLGSLRHAAHNAALLGVALVVAVLCLLLVFQDFASTMRNQPRLRYLINPLNSVYALGHVATQPLRMNTRTLLPVGRDAHLGASYAGQADAPLLVLVLGETGRSGNFGVNGYTRNTTPLLSARSDLASARNAWSCGTSTAASVPCMFSHLGRTGYEARAANFETLIDVLQHAGLAVLWVDNQSGCKGVCDRAGQISTTDLKDPALCAPGAECLDRVMLQDLDARIAALPAQQRQRGTVVVLHQMGSHGPAYSKRSAPEHKHFVPECTSTALQDCDRQQVVNAYDNSIVETDAFLDEVIRWLAARGGRANTAMVYVADHGESLGENNLYLHGLPYSIAPDVQKHVPWITWLSPAMQARQHTAIRCLQNDLSERRITHDSYFHSVLGLMDVQTGAYRPELDVYAGCRAASTSKSASTLASAAPLP
ncbi:phosphoethanolamine transferase [Paracidovorax sp. MALMAid1276]|uniref:phosphoethanolamine transferase n=1 Tax=Paracidovorax sp. MALMAid1276 TaxID=3411631 RepID=UPI003B9D8957